MGIDCIEKEVIEGILSLLADWVVHTDCIVNMHFHFVGVDINFDLGPFLLLNFIN